MRVLSIRMKKLKMYTVIFILLFMKTSDSIPQMPSNDNPRDGRNIGNVFTFLQDLFKANLTAGNTTAANDDTAADNTSDLADINAPLFNNTALLPVISHEASLILRERFRQLLRDIPSDIDAAIAEITEKQAKSNMLDYTVASSFIFGAAFDTVGDFFLAERQISDFLLSPGFIYLNGYLWGYAIGFGGPFWIGLESPYQDCGGVNFADVVDRLDFQLERIVDLPESQRYIVTRKFRFQKETELFCLTSKIDSNKMASKANTKMDELLNIISKYAPMRAKADNPDAEVIPLDPDRAKELAESMDQLDDELQALFDGFEQQIIKAFDNAYASKVSDNLVKIMIGIPNLIGMISGILMVAETYEYEELPFIDEVPGTLINNTLNLTLNGQAANDFQIGQTLAIIAQQGWGYGYYAPYFTRLEDPDPGCGVHDFMDLVRNYRDLSNFRVAFGSSQQLLNGEIELRLENLPNYVKYRIERFSGEARVGLQCLLSRVDEASYDLLFSLESWLDIAIYRMDLAAELMNVL